jgi:hypothetical protein
MGESCCSWMGGGEWRETTTSEVVEGWENVKRMMGLHDERGGGYCDGFEKVKSLSERVH